MRNGGGREEGVGEFLTLRWFGELGVEVWVFVLESFGWVGCGGFRFVLGVSGLVILSVVYREVVSVVFRRGLERREFGFYVERGFVGYSFVRDVAYRYILEARVESLG